MKGSLQRNSDDGSANLALAIAASARLIYMPGALLYPAERGLIPLKEADGADVRFKPRAEMFDPRSFGHPDGAYSKRAFLRSPEILPTGLVRYSELNCSPNTSRYIASDTQFTLTRLTKEVIACAAVSFNGEITSNHGKSVRRANVFQPTARWMRVLTRFLFLGALLVLSIAVSNLSPRCGFAGEKPTRDADSPKETKTERPPFDLTYLHPKAMGVIAIRPSAIFSDPAMKPLAAVWNEELAQLRQELKLSGVPKLAIEDIEEIIGFIMIVPGDKKLGHDHRLRFILTMIRVKHDFDWVKLMRLLDPKMEEVRHEDRLYYRIFSPKNTMCYFMPDKRSVAFLFQKKTMSEFLKGQNVERPHFSWDEDWKRVENGLIAVAMDNRWTHGLSKEQLGDEPGWALLAQNAATMVAGVDWKDGIDFHVYLTGKNRAVCDQIVKDIKVMLAQLRDESKEQPPKDVSEAERKATSFQLQVYKDLVEQARIQQSETMVCVHTKAKINLADLAKCLLFLP
ncbi:MAG TPA: hypothetical protein VMF69_03610 [Gemmataceae bacterium]|nr:hypothetical protein [Gemmataceae bacterium]